jgi:type II secretory pathway pseudopilin PulG
MKLTKTSPIKRMLGMTLLELTVVILVLLSLISILFIGARAWKRGSDRAGCILNIRNAQQAVRANANMRVINEGSAFVQADVFGSGKLIDKELTALACPQEGTGAYTASAATTVPAVGVLYLACKAPTGDAHVPGSYADW